MIDVVVSAAVTVVLAWVLGEVLHVFEPLAAALIRSATQLLPSEKAARYRAEWLAEMEAVTGPDIVKVRFALSVTRGAGVMAYEARSTFRVPRRRHRKALAPQREELFAAGFVLFVIAMLLLLNERARREGRPHVVFGSRAMGPGAKWQPDAVIESPGGRSVIEFKTVARPDSDRP